ncbi:MAG: chromate efflux transporter [Dehalococcoidia bacterium]|nr:chromate efflux transporter [Dehalococcoidia bacterium]
MAERNGPPQQEGVRSGVTPQAAFMPTFGEAFRYWLRLGFINFGGPAGQIAIMHKELVQQRKWIGERAFLNGLNYATLLPGPEAQQVATYIGWRLHGTLGGLVAGTFFVLPAVTILLVLSWLAAAHANVTVVAGALYGVQPVVIGIVAEAVVRIGRRALRPRALVGIAVAAFVAIYFLHIPFPLIVATAALIGLLAQRFTPALFQAPGRGETIAAPVEKVPPFWPRALKILAVSAAIWAIPVGAILLWQGADSTLFREARFFTWAAFITFGGAYAVLSFVADQAVNVYGWLSGAQMVQGLGLAESTPGPLIMVLQYVGFFGGYNNPGTLNPLLSGVLGALTTTFVTFLPSIMFVFLGAPYIELLGRNKRIATAMTAVTAAVVGVIANLGMFFATKVLFPATGGFDWFAALAAPIAFIAAWRFKVPLHVLVIAGIVTGITKLLIQQAVMG